MANYISEPAYQAITRYCMESTTTNAIELSTELMLLPEIKFHSPEHHYLIGATLVTVYCNSTNPNQKSSFLPKIYQRTKSILPGSCGIYGVCGDVLASGAAISLILEASPLSTTKLQTLNQASLVCQEAMAQYEGPRCCKRSTYLTLLTVTNWMRQQINTPLENPVEVVCRFSDDNETCALEKCQFFHQQEN